MFFDFLLHAFSDFRLSCFPILISDSGLVF